MAPDVTFKLQFQGSDGKIYTVDLNNPSHLDWLHQRLGIYPLKSKIQELERRMEKAEKPVRLQKILDLLKEQFSGRTERWIKKRVPDFTYSDLSDLKAQGKILPYRVGNCWKYRLFEYGKVMING